MSKPIVTTLCGSTRFPEAFALANMHLSLQGRVVIGLGMMGHADEPRGARHLTSDGDETTPIKQGLDQLHFRKIDVSDGIFVVNVGGYVGSSTRREIEYARAHGKTVEWLFPDAAPDAAATPDGEGEPCGRLLVGRGTDTWDPTCVLPKGHRTTCESSAEDQEAARKFYAPKAEVERDA